MVEAGMWITVNPDDPGYFPGSMNINLIRLQQEVDLSMAGIVQLAENAFESAWLPRATKNRYFARLKAYAVQSIIISSSRVRERPNKKYRADAVTRAV
jgi:adenine deaminase